MLFILLLILLFLVIIILALSYWSVQRVKIFRIAGCRALVTGGSSGIGFEVAKVLIKEKASLVIIAARRESQLLTAAELLRKDAEESGTRIMYVVMDVSNTASVRAAMKSIQEENNNNNNNNNNNTNFALDLVICCAGFAVPARFLDTTIEDCTNMMNSNFFGAVNITREVLPGMLTQRHGRIVLISSLAARCPIAGYTIYSASKAALRAFAHSLDMENSCFNIRCQVVSPPDVDTPGLREENLRKSPECLAISSFGGNSPCTAASVANNIIKGIQHYSFDICVGFDSLLLGWGSAGMEPATCFRDLIIQIIINGWLRLFMVVFSKLHYGIVRRVRHAEENEKQQEKEKRGGEENKKKS